MAAESSASTDAGRAYKRKRGWEFPSRMQASRLSILAPVEGGGNKDSPWSYPGTSSASVVLRRPTATKMAPTRPSSRLRRARLDAGRACRYDGRTKSPRGFLPHLRIRARSRKMRAHGGSIPRAQEPQRRLTITIRPSTLRRRTSWNTSPKKTEEERGTLSGTAWHRILSLLDRLLLHDSRDGYRTTRRAAATASPR